MALLGEPLSGRQGVLAYAVQGAWGTPVTPGLSAGLVNLDSTENPDLEELFGVGSDTAQFVRAKGQKNEATVNISSLQNLGFLSQGVRVTGGLPVLTVAFGLQDDAGTMWAKVYQDCKVDSWEVSCQEEGLVAASVKLILGKMVPSSAIGRPTALTEFPFQWIDGVLSVGGVGKLLQSWKLAVSHNVERKFPIRATAAPADEARLPYRLREGVQKISFELVTYQTLGISRQADVPASTTVSLAMVSRADAANTADFNLTGCYFGEEQHSGEAEGDITFTNRGIATGITLA